MADCEHCGGQDAEIYALTQVIELSHQVSRHIGRSPPWGGPRRRKRVQNYQAFLSQHPHRILGRDRLESRRKVDSSTKCMMPRRESRNVDRWPGSSAAKRHRRGVGPNPRCLSAVEIVLQTQDHTLRSLVGLSSGEPMRSPGVMTIH